jgi:ubiquitin C-terminal hydrolase
LRDIFESVEITLSDDSAIKDFFYIFGSVFDAHITSCQYYFEEKMVAFLKEEVDYFLKICHRRLLDQQISGSFICGYLHLMSFIYSNCSWLRDDSYNLFNENVLQYLFDSIFEVSNDKSKFKTLMSRRTAFALISYICKKEELAKLFLYKILQLHKSYSYPDDWNYNPQEKIRAKSGYSGLINLGCICYLNASLQQLFLSSRIRSGILLADGFEYPMDNQTQEDSKSVHPNAYFIALQELFADLLASECKAVNPGNLCSTYINLEGNPIDVTEQMDANEFINILFDKIDNTLKNTPYEKLLLDTFGGKFSNQIKCKACGNVSEREEAFYTLTVNIKNKKSLYEALLAFVEGEVLSGSNAYFCACCNQKQEAVKRTCVKFLPQTLIVALKRFEFDYNDMVKVKLNDYVEFPLELEMQKFTKEYFEIESEKENPLPQNTSTYDLVGILVHSGTSDGGHYYSYVRSLNADGSRGSWLEFNDQDVNSFDISNLAEACFGGLYNVDQFDRKARKTVRRTINRPNNAYMLFYEKRDVLQNNSSQVIAPTKFLDGINKRNNRLQTELAIFEPHFYDFIWQIVHVFAYGSNDVSFFFCIRGD